MKLKQHVLKTMAAVASTAAVRVIRTAYGAGYESDWHHNRVAQLIYPCRGTMALYTHHGLWIVPPLRACWLPALEDHRISTTAGFEMSSVYCEGAILRRMPKRCGIVTVPPLLRELILALEYPQPRPKSRYLALLLAQEVVVDETPQLFLSPLLSRKLQTIGAALINHPSDNRTLARWATELATTPRSLARAFEREAKMSFVAYRRQVRLQEAIRRLAKAETVTSIAMELGFGSASNFIRVFREATGVTPGQYFAIRCKSTAHS